MIFLQGCYASFALEMCSRGPLDKVILLWFRSFIRLHHHLARGTFAEDMLGYIVESLTMIPSHGVGS